MNNDYKLELTQINKKLSLCIELFNTIIIDLKKIISKETAGNIAINIYSGVVDKIIETRKYEPISFFIRHIYSNDSYRNNIIEGNESFFADQNFDDITKEDEKKIKLLFQFKSYWKDFTLEKKEFIKNSMKTLVNICKKYIEEKDNGNKLLSKYV